MEKPYELGDVDIHRLNSKKELSAGSVFKAAGNAEGQTEIFWEVISKVDKTRYMCKVVGINTYAP
jgi:hypothetical protein